MIIWNGLGFLVFVIVFGCSLVANLVTNQYTGGTSAYWDAHRWPLGVALGAAGVLSWLFGLALKQRPGRDALFFIPVRWWGLLLVLGGAGVAGYDLYR